MREIRRGIKCDEERIIEKGSYRLREQSNREEEKTLR